MRPTASFLSGALPLALIAAMAFTAQPAAARNASPEAKLARAIEGRVAGEPVDCLYLRDIRSSRIIDDTAILYETTGGTLYVNRPRSGETSLDSRDVMITDTHSPRLCNIDVVRLVESSTFMQTGFVMLGDFVPYRKPPRPSQSGPADRLEQ